MTMLVVVILVVVAVMMTACLPIGLRWHRRRERVLRHLSERLREFAELQVELSERRVLLNRPWEEDLLHWAHDGNGWRLHGSVLPPDGRRRRSTTSRGWCPALHTAPGSPSSVPPAS